MDLQIRKGGQERRSEGRGGKKAGKKKGLGCGGGQYECYLEGGTTA